MYQATSTAVRGSALDSVKQDAVERERSATARAVRRELTIESSKEQRALEAMAKAIGKYVHRHGGSTRKAVTTATAGQHRALATIDDAISRAIAEGWVERSGDAFVPGKSRPA